MRIVLDAKIRTHLYVPLYAHLLSSTIPLAHALIRKVLTCVYIGWRCFQLGLLTGEVKVVSAQYHEGIRAVDVIAHLISALD